MHSPLWDVVQTIYNYDRSGGMSCNVTAQEHLDSVIFRLKSPAGIFGTFFLVTSPPTRGMLLENTGWTFKPESSYTGPNLVETQR